MAWKASVGRISRSGNRLLGRHWLRSTSAKMESSSRSWVVSRLCRVMVFFLWCSLVGHRRSDGGRRQPQPEVRSDTADRLDGAIGDGPGERLEVRLVLVGIGRREL